MKWPTVTIREEQGKYWCYRPGKGKKPARVGWGWCLASLITFWETRGYRVVMGQTQ